MAQLLVSSLLIFFGLLELVFCKRIIKFLRNFSIRKQAGGKVSVALAYFIVLAQGSLIVYIGIIGIIYYFKH
jgi:uncharacterized membrane protein